MSKEVKDELSIFLEVTKNVALSLAVILFFIGWIYLYYFFKYFGISMFNIKVELTSLYIYAFRVLLQTLPAIIFFVYLIVLGLLFHFRNFFGTYFRIIIFSVAITIFPCFYLIARCYAAERASRLLHNDEQTNVIYFNFTKSYLNECSRKVDSSGTLSRILSTSLAFDLKADSILLMRNKHYQLRLFFENDNDYVVLYNPNSDTSKQLIKNIEMYRVAKNQINFAKIMINNNELNNLKQIWQNE
ncbi:MAG TPA: hypothetical protein VE978_22750 [Chitinophagales bacterium]|nr:hypothetical protein [Chitinophagales bacterium]